MTEFRPFRDAHTEARRSIENALADEPRAAAWGRGDAGGDGFALAMRVADEILGPAADRSAP